MLQTPLRFTPLFRKYLWGGRRLQTSLGKSIGPEGNYAESWEIVDHGPDQSIVLAGKWAGQSLNEILMKEGEALLGRDFEQWSQTHQIQGLGKRFPLLFTVGPRLLPCIAKRDLEAFRFEFKRFGLSESCFFGKKF